MPYNAGGRWTPAPGQSYAPETPLLSGVWGEPTLPEGPNEIQAEGYTYRLPLLADVQIVTGARGLTFLHVKHDGKTFVLARGLQQLSQDPRTGSRSRRVY